MSVDLAESGFWITLVLAWGILTPLTQNHHKHRCLSLINLGFIAWVISPLVAASTGVLIWLLTVILRKSQSQESRASFTLVIALICFLLFALAKVGWLTQTLTIPAFRKILVGLGYSYIVLRVIYLTREVYEEREQVPTWTNAVNYLVPFHMLAAGPIQSYSDYRAEGLRSEPPTTEDTVSGLERISTGLFKKFVLAELISRIFLTQFQHPDASYLLLELQLNYLWLYLDFSGYSDIAVGVGRLVGYRAPENFDRPLTAPNLIDFWERWHITLSKFIKLNIFLPIQFWAARRVGGRWPLWIGTVSFLISFLLCGLWHGVSWRFLFWGGLHGMGLAACKAYQGWAYRRFGRKKLKQNSILRVMSTILTFEFIALSWLVASAPEGTMERLWNLL